uniref:Putative secreted peptide n=1 Tax=Anopheles braziliensis TaxID=58242 RepID=A0A2M3ZSC7_9DIPT
MLKCPGSATGFTIAAFFPVNFAGNACHTTTTAGTPGGSRGSVSFRCRCCARGFGVGWVKHNPQGPDKSG